MERLFAKAVASDEDFFGSGIPDSEGEHAVEVFNTRVAPLLISRQNYFCIAGGFEVVPVLRELRSQLLVVIDFPVKNDPKPAIMAGHRLMPAWREIQDRKAAEAEGEIEMVQT